MEQQIPEIIGLMADNVESGNTNPLSVYIELKRIEKSLEAAIKVVQPLAVDEAVKHGQKSFEAFGAKVEMRATGGRWDYKNVHQLSELTKKVKTLQELAQSASKGVQVFDENGEQIEAAIKIEGKENLAVTI